MKYLAIILISTGLLCQTSLARPTSYNFASTKWAMTRQAVKASMAKNGYVYQRVDSAGDLWFKGIVSQEKANIVALFTSSNKLVQLQVILTPDSNFVIQRFKIIKEALIKKYGSPSESIYSFASPYKSGDGFETQAIKLGKATLSSAWMTDYIPVSSTRKISYTGLTLKVYKDLSIYISYTASGWNKEYKKRYDKDNNDL